MFSTKNFLSILLQYKLIVANPMAVITPEADQSMGETEIFYEKLRNFAKEQAFDTQVIETSFKDDAGPRCLIPRRCRRNVAYDTIEIIFNFFLSEYYDLFEGQDILNAEKPKCKTVARTISETLRRGELSNADPIILLLRSASDFFWMRMLRVRLMVDVLALVRF